MIYFMMINLTTSHKIQRLLITLKCFVRFKLKDKSKIDDIKTLRKPRGCTI